MRGPPRASAARWSHPPRSDRRRVFAPRQPERLWGAASIGTRGCLRRAPPALGCSRPHRTTRASLAIPRCAGRVEGKPAAAAHPTRPRSRAAPPSPPALAHPQGARQCRSPRALARPQRAAARSSAAPWGQGLPGGEGCQGPVAAVTPQQRIALGASSMTEPSLSRWRTEAPRREQGGGDEERAVAALRAALGAHDRRRRRLRGRDQALDGFEERRVFCHQLVARAYQARPNAALSPSGAR